MMDGNITFESEYEKGTKFIINLWQGIGTVEETENEKEKRKMISGLMRLGYTYGEIRQALSDYDIPEVYGDEY